LCTHALHYVELARGNAASSKFRRDVRQRRPGSTSNAGDRPAAHRRSARRRCHSVDLDPIRRSSSTFGTRWMHNVELGARAGRMPGV
jgi:hypothetical protein